MRIDSESKLQNEKEFEKVIIEHGFEIHVMEGMTIRQQAELFYQAKVVISTHGA